MANRNAIAVRHNHAYFDWIMNLPDCPKGYTYEKHMAEQPRTLYLVAYYETEQELEESIEEFYEEIFENELRDWNQVRENWPQNRSFDLFKSYFSIEAYSSVHDMYHDVIVKEDDKSRKSK